jgi:hypothetical protein
MKRDSGDGHRWGSWLFYHLSLASVHVWSGQKRRQPKLPSVQTVTITGNPSETALMRYAMEMTDATALRDRFHIVFEVRIFTVFRASDLAS